MGHRHLPDPFNMFGVNQGRTQNHQVEQSYHPMGGFVASENGSLVPPLNNMSRSGLYSDPRSNLAVGENEYTSSSFSREVQNFPPECPVHSYNPYSHSAAAGNMVMYQESNARNMHPSYSNRHIIHDVEGGISDPSRGTGRGSSKRKSPAGPVFYGPSEGGSSRRSYDVGSSSGSSQMLPEKPTSDYRSVSLGPMGLPQHRGSGLSIAGEDSLRNVRSQSTLDAEANPMRAHLWSYPSQLYHPTSLPVNPSVTVNPGSLNSGSTSQVQNQGLFSAAAPERTPSAVINGSSHTMNQFVVGGNATNAGVRRQDYVSSGRPFSSPQFASRTFPQVSRESRSAHSRRAISTYRTNLSYSHLGHPQSHPENSASRFSRPLSAGGWRNSYRNVRPRLSMERLQSISNVVDGHDRRRTEVPTMVSHSSFYNGSRSSVDQYRDMRLDVDNMSYEELLALEETIGNVSTGLSEDMIARCVVGKVFCSGNQNHEEDRCAICLEEYESGDAIGTLKSCQHDYHVNCISKWLAEKNVCPICKASALTESLS